MQNQELLERYGPTMDMDDLADFFGITKGTIHNKISKGKFEVPVFKISGRIKAETVDVVQYINEAKMLKR